MSRWFRLYDDVLHDPKVQMLPPHIFKAWINLLCIASKGNGQIRNSADLQFNLRLSIPEVKEVLDILTEAGLLVEEGGHFKPHNWDKRQYKSDVTDPTNAERQRRWKSKHLGNGAVTENETELKRPDTDTDTDTDTDRKIERGNSRKRTKTRIPDDWCPKNDSVEGGQRLGFSAAEIGREAQRFKNHAREKDRMAVLWDAAFDNWLIKAAEYANKSPPSEKTEFFPALPGSPEFQAWHAHWRDAGNSVMLRELAQRELEGRAFKFASQWPPGFKTAA